MHEKIYEYTPESFTKTLIKVSEDYKKSYNEKFNYLNVSNSQFGLVMEYFMGSNNPLITPNKYYLNSYKNYEEIEKFVYLDRLNEYKNFSKNEQTLVNSIEHNINNILKGFGYDFKSFMKYYGNFNQIELLMLLLNPLCKIKYYNEDTVDYFKKIIELNIDSINTLKKEYYSNLNSNENTFITLIKLINKLFYEEYTGEYGRLVKFSSTVGAELEAIDSNDYYSYLFYKRLSEKDFINISKDIKDGFTFRLIMIHEELMANHLDSNGKLDKPLEWLYEFSGIKSIDNEHDENLRALKSAMKSLNSLRGDTMKIVNSFGGDCNRTIKYKDAPNQSLAEALKI